MHFRPGLLLPGLTLLLSLPCWAPPMPWELIPYMGRDAAMASGAGRAHQPTDKPSASQTPAPTAGPFQGDYNAFTVVFPTTIHMARLPGPVVDQFDYRCDEARFSLVVHLGITHEAGEVAHNVANPHEFADAVLQGSSRPQQPVVLNGATGMETSFLKGSVYDRSVVLQSPDGRMQFFLEARWTGETPVSVKRFFDTFKMGQLNYPVAPVASSAPAATGQPAAPLTPTESATPVTPTVPVGAENRLEPYLYRNLVALDVPQGWNMHDHSRDGETFLYWAAPDNKGVLFVLLVDMEGGDAQASQKFLGDLFVKRSRQGDTFLGAGMSHNSYIMRAGTRVALLWMGVPPAEVSQWKDPVIQIFKSVRLNQKAALTAPREVIP